MRNHRKSRGSAALAACTAGIFSATIASYACAQTNLLIDYNFAPGVSSPTGTSPNASTGNVSMTNANNPDAGPWMSWNNWAGPPYAGTYASTAFTGLPSTSSGNGGSDQYGVTWGGNNGNPGTSNGGIYQFVSVTAGDTYTASGFFDNSAIANLGEDQLNPGQTDSVEMNFYSGANGTGTLLVSDVSPGNVNANTPTDVWTQESVTGIAPIGTESVEWLAFWNNPVNEGGALYVDDASLIQIITTPTWNGGGADDNWTTPGNWGGTAPIPTNSLVFDGTVQITNNNNYAANTIFDGITFNPTAGAFVLGGNSIALAADIVNNSSSAQTVNLALALQQNTNINAAAGNIAIGGAITGAFSLTANGAHVVTLTGSNSYSGGTNVSAGTLVIGAAGALPANSAVSISGGTLKLALNTGGETLSSLSIAANSALDIGNNHIIVSDPGGSIDAAIRGYLADGYNGGAWNGTSGGGIITSAPTSIGAGTYGVGYADGANGVVAGLSSGELEVAYTLAGDANLDGKVDSADFGILADNYGASGAVWDEGDFNYDGKVDSADFGILAVNYGQSAGSNADVVTAADWSALDAFEAANGVTLSAVPEPASAGLLVLACLGSLARRRKRAL